MSNEYSLAPSYITLRNYRPAANRFFYLHLAYERAKMLFNLRQHLWQISYKLHKLQSEYKKVNEARALHVWPAGCPEDPEM